MTPREELYQIILDGDPDWLQWGVWIGVFENRDSKGVHWVRELWKLDISHDLRELLADLAERFPEEWTKWRAYHRLTR